jgi:hypothetical protein
MIRIIFGVLFILIGLYFLAMAAIWPSVAALGAFFFTFVFCAAGLPMIIYGAKSIGKKKI